MLCIVCLRTFTNPVKLRRRTIPVCLSEASDSEERERTRHQLFRLTFESSDILAQFDDFWLLEKSRQAAHFHKMQ